MKTYKITGVAKDVCCVEQMLAYNIAFRIHINHDRDFEQCTTAAEKDILVKKYRDMYMGFLANESKRKYNPDALFVALNHGLKKYIDKFFIASDYETVGRAFPIPY